MPSALSVNYLSVQPHSADLVIVCGGVAGAATAFYAARASYSPLLPEKRPALCHVTVLVSTGAFRL